MSRLLTQYQAGPFFTAGAPRTSGGRASFWPRVSLSVSQTSEPVSSGLDRTSTLRSKDRSLVHTKCGASRASIARATGSSQNCRM
eukprot:scaffold26401_cov61-Phaeocystis_antarctica.AAC.3